jgi:magnesium transporter
MIHIYYRVDSQVHLLEDINALPTIDKDHIIWVDLLGWSENEEAMIEDYFKVEIMNKAESMEIEQSSRFVEYDNFVISNSNFVTKLLDSYHLVMVSFTLSKNTLFTVRDHDFTTFKEIARKLTGGPNKTNSADIFLNIVDLRIAHDADLVEDVTHEITELSKALLNEKFNKKPLILKLNTLRETMMLLMQNCIDKKLLISNIKKTPYLSRRIELELEISVKDLESVIDFIRFNFDRLDYLDSTLNHLITYEQNNSIKLFTIVSLFFMPPMLIASIYGMNFEFMPELPWKFGYPFALLLMLLTVIATAIYFKRKRWL